MSPQEGKVQVEKVQEGGELQGEDRWDLEEVK